MSLIDRRNKFIEAFQSGDHETALSLLPQLKIALAQENLLVPTHRSLVDNPQTFSLALEVVETAALLSLARQDIPAFERSVAQAKSFYSVIPAEGGLPTPSKDRLLGLNLVRLLAYGKRAQFYIELEAIPASLQSAEHIKHALFLEQCLNDGSYHRIFTVQLPHYYSYFLDLLANTMRLELASCMQKAYRSIPVSNAARILHLTPSSSSSLTESVESTLHSFVQQQGWQIVNDEIIFNHGSEDKACVSIPSFELLGRAFEYANELERIV